MKTFRKLAWIVSSAILLSGMALSQTTTPEAQAAVVVKLHTHFSTQKKDETAAGVFVGKDQQYAYFITARHAVADDVENHEVHAQSTKLWFNGSPQSFDASVFERTDAILDLGVVYLPLANLPTNLCQIVRKDVAVNVSVRIVGHPAAGDWSVWQGTVQNENAPSGDVYHFITTTNPSLAYGYSGGPVFDPEGNFLGMHTATIASYGIAAKGADIVTKLIKGWHVPTNNLLDVLPEPDPEAIKRVLRQYEQAYNQRDAKALWKIWPNPSAGKKQAIIAYFDNTTSITRTLQKLDIKIAANSATVAGLFSDLFTPKDGDQQSLKNKKISFLFRKNDGVWSIDDVK